MQIVFLNTFERQTEEGANVSAQLTISEEQGVWGVDWLEEKEGSETERWFEGVSWEEMMTAFRYGIARMMGQGFAPIVDGMLESERGPGSYLTMLQCYGEMHANDELFQLLKDWRRKTAASEKKSAYLVATNRMLWMISAFVPQSGEELSQIPGWGKAKQEAYGEAVLHITAGAERATGFPLDWVPGALDAEQYTAWLYKQKENKYKGMMDRQQEKKQILHILQQAGGLDQLQKELKLSRRELLLRIEQLEQEGYDIDPLLDRELSLVEEGERELIWQALSTFGDRYLKPVLAQVYGEDPQAHAERPVEQLYERLRLMRMSYRRKKHEKAV
ncbi:HRDC domain-containing protein [Paenibacillus soyae]|uniref:HRDC domain-containing protein n=1 Tax=Paenibacillus soyae TaxID=2969249 RepID=A0A9X2S701_9BACL|nr:HRDC domain-containing protein [Paenibacillus soyae]MCR2802535.1 HRDC domain-containing protein [Paenibacillus soyae]